MQHISNHSYAIERSVLGTLLGKPELWHDAKEIIKPQMFEINQTLAGTFWEEMEAHGKVNLFSLAEKLKSQEPFHLAKEIDLNNLADNCFFLKEQFIRKVEIDIHTRAILALSQGVHYTEVLVQEDQERMQYDAQKSVIETRQEGINKALALIDKARTSEGLSGVDTGFVEINEECGGWQNSDLIIVAGRPGMGKTVAGVTYALAAASTGVETLYFSLEVSSEQMWMRFASGFSGVTVKEMRTGIKEDGKYNMVINAMNQNVSELPIHVLDKDKRLTDICNKIRYFKRKHNLGMVVIDYLTLIRGKDKKMRTEEIGDITRTLKEVAKELNIPIIVLSQLSRAVEIRGGAKRPQLSDLRDSGEIEQDADMVFLLYRPEYYQVMEDEDGNSLKGVVEMILSKNRNGGLKTVKARFGHPFSQFLEVDNFYQEIEVPDNFIPAPQEDDTDLPF